MSPVTVKKIAKKHAQKWRIFPQFSAFFQWCPLRQKKCPTSLAKSWLRAWCRNYASRLSKSKTSLNHGCTVVLPALCRLRLSALVNHARTAGRTSNLDKTGMIRRMCRWAMKMKIVYFSLYSVFPKVKFSNASLVPIATFFKHGLPHLQARISNLQARHVPVGTLN